MAVVFTGGLAGTSRPELRVPVKLGSPQTLRTLQARRKISWAVLAVSGHAAVPLEKRRQGEATISGERVKLVEQEPYPLSCIMIGGSAGVGCDAAPRVGQTVDGRGDELQLAGSADRNYEQMITKVRERIKNFLGA